MTASLELVALLASAGIGLIQTGVLVEIARRQGKVSATTDAHGQRIDRQGQRLDQHGDRLDRHSVKLGLDP